MSRRTHRQFSVSIVVLPLSYVQAEEQKSQTGQEMVLKWKRWRAQQWSASVTVGIFVTIHLLEETMKLAGAAGDG